MVVDGEEQRQREALAAGVDHPVLRRLEQAVGPAFQHVADIDDEGAGDRRRLDPFIGGVHHLQPRRLLVQDGEALEIRMGADAEMGVVHRQLVRRVVQQPQLRRRLARALGEEAVRQAQPCLEGPEQPLADLGDPGVVVEDPVAEARHPVRPLVRHQHDVAGPEVGVVLGDLDRQVEGGVQPRLQVVVALGRALDQGVELRVAVVVLGRDRDPAARPRRAADMDVLLLLDRPVMEGAGQRVGLLDQRLGHAVVADVEEADRLAGLADLVDRAAPGLVVAAGQRADVDDGNGFEGQEARAHRAAGRLNLLVHRGYPLSPTASSAAALPLRADALTMPSFLGMAGTRQYRSKARASMQS